MYMDSRYYQPRDTIFKEKAQGFIDWLKQDDDDDDEEEEDDETTAEN
jgi:hypothetical protein